MGLFDRVFGGGSMRELNRIASGNIKSAAEELWSVLSDEELRFIQVKWNMDIGTTDLSANPPRPRSLTEIARALGVDEYTVREFDIALMGRLLAHGNNLLEKRSLAAVLLYDVCDWVLQPVETVQQWWDENLSARLTTDGRSRLTCDACGHSNGFGWDQMAGPNAPRKLPCEACNRDLRKQ